MPSKYRSKTKPKAPHGSDKHVYVALCPKCGATRSLFYYNYGLKCCGELPIKVKAKN